jgi:type VI protein secretion system component VasF
MHKHTPGPWTLIDDYGRFDVDSARHNVCSVSNHDPRHEANARLIAAAPELLAALKELCSAPNKKRPERVWEEARAAIVKAEGTE